MNIKTEKWIIDGSISYKILEIEKCCDKLINSNNISINIKPDENEAYILDSPEYSVKISRCEEYWEDGYDYTCDYHEKISFCPFCGELIIIKIVNEIDKTEEYKLLQEQRNMLWKKYRNTDSKKKEDELKQQVRELDMRINEMLNSDDFKKVLNF